GIFLASLLSLVLSACATVAPPVAPLPEPVPAAQAQDPVVPKTREPVIALVLGGGGVKGFAHVGVIKVLESHGIKPSIVVGTSAG
ncbi:patatin-like phospholipase family protein, partial [Vibrio vulnificus]|uniref:patatin-like phospholipase family protein n=2 Tax=Pseudomonadota TaxID=1224 RepID=UPI0039B68B92